MYSQWVPLLTDANFHGADLTGASIESVDFENADLTDAILSEAQVSSLDLVEFKDPQYCIYDGLANQKVKWYHTR